MKKLNLVAMGYDRNGILNALERTGAVEVKAHAPSDFARSFSQTDTTAAEHCTAAENALAVLQSEIRAYASDHKIKLKLSEEVAVSYSDFMAVGENGKTAEELIAKICALTDEKNALKAELNRLARQLKSASVYENLTLPFSAFRAEGAVTYALGALEPRAADELKLKLFELPLVAERVISTGESVVLGVCYHNSCKEEIEKLLGEANYIRCPYHTDETGRQLCDRLKQEIAAVHGRLSENGAQFYALREEIPALQIYADFMRFEAEKSGLSEKMLSTDATFLLEAYVPVTGVEAVKTALEGAAGAVYYEFSEVPEDEMPPTLLKNNAVVDNFEAVTNMYSAPNAREFDPNAIMAFFYSLFMGFIMADIGYGLMMMVGGGVLWWKKREGGGLKRLAGVFAIGGVFAVIWGVLFNSFFGFKPFPFTVMPDAKEATWTFIGVRVPSVLFIALEIGVVQLGAGYVCKAVQCWRRGQVLDGILDGMVWALFSVGVALALLGLIEEAHVSSLALVGGIIAGAMLLAGVLTAGRKEKLVGKFTKGFGAAYGVINYASDILSYARLYGLMLSGAVIAEIITQYAVTGANGGVGMIMSGNVGLIILGVVLMVVGHVFNLALSLLGAYIHDARLQYVEFYGKFYEGEGELFTPLGSDKKYVRVK